MTISEQIDVAILRCRRGEQLCRAWQERFLNDCEPETFLLSEDDAQCCREAIQSLGSRLLQIVQDGLASPYSEYVMFEAGVCYAGEKMLLAAGCTVGEATTCMMFDLMHMLNGDLDDVGNYDEVL